MRRSREMRWTVLELSAPTGWRCEWCGLAMRKGDALAEIRAAVLGPEGWGPLEGGIEGHRLCMTRLQDLLAES